MSTLPSLRLHALFLLLSGSFVWSCSSSDRVGHDTPASAAGSGGASAGASHNLAGASFGSAGATAAGGAPAAAAGAGGGLGVAGSAELGGASGSATAGSNAGGSSGAAQAGATGVLGFGGAPTDKPDTVEVGVRNNCGFSIGSTAKAAAASSARTIKNSNPMPSLGTMRPRCGVRRESPPTLTAHARTSSTRSR